MTLALKRVRVGERDEFIAFFRRADLVKYAKLVPEPVEAAAAVSVARDLVNKTTPEPEPEPEKKHQDTRDTKKAGREK
jgi:hypothetical protein